MRSAASPPPAPHPNGPSAVYVDVPLVALYFDNYLRHAEEISAFRGALVNLLGREDSDWFHNHDNSDSEKGFHYRYPLVQYIPQRDQQGRWRPTLICAGTAVREYSRLFERNDWTVRLQDRHERLALREIQPRTHRLELLPQPVRYRISDYLALNQRNVAAYHQCRGLAERIRFVECAMAGHVIALATGFGWTVPERFELTVERWREPRSLTFKRTPMLALDFVFSTRLSLPPGLGLGKGTSVGYGRIARHK